MEQLKLDREDFELFLEMNAGYVFTTMEVDECPLAEYLNQNNEDLYYITRTHAANATGMESYPLPEWAKKFSQLDMVGTGAELLQALRDAETAEALERR